MSTGSGMDPQSMSSHGSRHTSSTRRPREDQVRHVPVLPDGPETQDCLLVPFHLVQRARPVLFHERLLVGADPLVVRGRDGVLLVGGVGHPGVRLLSTFDRRIAGAFARLGASLLRCHCASSAAVGRSPWLLSMDPMPLCRRQYLTDRSGINFCIAHHRTQFSMCRPTSFGRGGAGAGHRPANMRV